MDAVTPFIAAQCLPGIGTWLLPCQQLLQLDVEGPAPVEVLHQGVLHNVPAVERLRLAQNMSNWSGGMPAFDAVSAPVLSASLTSLDLAEADAQLQPGALAALPRLRRLALGSLQLADFDLLDEVQDGLEQFEVRLTQLITACHLVPCAWHNVPACLPASPLAPIPPPATQFALYSGELPVEIGAFTRLKRLRISSWSGAVDPDPGEQLGDVLACLPLLEALSMATCWSLATSEQQQALWAAWTPATQRLRSLEVQCNGANELPPSAAPHLQQLHTLWCDFELLCNSPGILASCGQLRKLVFLVNGPPYGTSARPTPVMTARTIRQLAGNLAGLPHLAVVQCLNFRPSAGVATQLRAVAQSLLAEVHARLPRLGIPPVNLAGYEGGGTSDSIWDL